MARVESIVKTDLLVWARKTAGLNIEVAAKKAQIKPDRLEAWERGERHPTIPQLRKLCEIYKRPLAVLYLPEPPKEFPAMRDYRRLPGEVAGVESPELRLEIRRARYRREVALELFEDLEGIPPEFSESASIEEDPEILGNRIRELLGITYERQIKWSNEYEAFYWWQSAIEEQGILVFQATDVSIQEMRGFSIHETPIPVIVVNIKDHPFGRIFSLLHEFTHILLKEGGLCDLHEDNFRPPAAQRMEMYCNHVSGATLVAEIDLLREDIVQRMRVRKTLGDDQISFLARRYSVGREALLRRLLIFDRITHEFYAAKRRQYRKEWEAEKRRGGGFASPERIALSSVGPTFAQLALSGYYRGVITGSDLSDYLELRLKHIPSFEEKVARRMAKG